MLKQVQHIRFSSPRNSPSSRFGLLKKTSVQLPEAPPQLESLRYFDLSSADTTNPIARQGIADIKMGVPFEALLPYGIMVAVCFRI